MFRKIVTGHGTRRMSSGPHNVRTRYAKENWMCVKTDKHVLSGNDMECVWSTGQLLWTGMPVPAGTSYHSITPPRFLLEYRVHSLPSIQDNYPRQMASGDRGAPVCNAQHLTWALIKQYFIVLMYCFWWVVIAAQYTATFLRSNVLPRI